MLPQIPNGIGEFIIGESSIGDDPFYWQQTLYSQYANSPVIYQLLDYFSQAIDADQVIDEWYDQTWNVLTAVGYGLDVWGRIVGVNRVIQVSEVAYLSTNESGGNATPQGFVTLYSGGSTTQNYALSDDAFRLLILAKAAANIWDGSIPGLNAILQLLFPGQVSYVTSGTLSMAYTFEWQPTPVQLSIIATTGALPTTAGVATSIVII